MTHDRSFRHKLLISASLSALLLGGVAQAQSEGGWGRGRGAGADPAATAARVAQEQALKQAQTSSATQRALDALRRATQTRTQMQDAQMQARIAAQQALNAIPNGLGQGGLQAAPEIEIDPSLWVGAGGPQQGAGKDGRTNVTVEQTQQKAILTWDSFNVGRETDLTFNQQGADWVVLNRVRDADASQIHGSINAKGTVLILNQNGILFGGASSVNVRNLVASSANITNDDFLNRGIYSQLQGTNYLPSFTGAGGAITVEAGAQIRTHAPTSITSGGGYVLLMGTEVTNAGSITTPRGQTLLSAGDEFIVRRGYGTAENPYSTTRGNEVRGLISGGSTSGAVTNSGLIEATQGDITLGGRTIRQDGVLVSTTGVNQRGTIHLLNGASDTQGSVTLGKDSLTIILPELEAKDTALNGQRDALIKESTTANANRLSTTTGGFDDRSTLADRLDQSRIEIVTGGDVVFEGGSNTSAQGGQVAVQANAGRITVEKDARIDVSGVMGVALDMESNSILVNVQGNEMRDSPANRDNDKLRSNDVWIDVRDLILLPDGTGGYEGDRWYTAGGLLEVGGHLANMAHGIGEWTAVGGTITLAANEVVAQQGAVFDISGGSLDYAAGWVNSTRVLGADGKLYDLRHAPAGIKMVAWGDAFIRNHERWGEAYTQVWSHPLGGARSSRRWSDGYSVGRDAGQLILSAPTVIMESDIVAGVINGERQTNARADGVSDGYKLGQHTVAKAGTLALGRYGVLSGLGLFDVDVKIGDFDAITPEITTDLGLPDIRVGTAWFDATRLNEAGLSGIKLETRGAIAVESDLRLANGGSVDLVAPTIDIAANITARSGSIKATNLFPGGAGRGGGEVLLDADGAARLQLHDGATLDVRGLWANAASGDAAGELLSHIDGGVVSLSSTHDVIVEAGSMIDASSGAAILAQGQMAGGRGGDVSLIADVVNATADPDGVLMLGGQIRGEGVLGGGTLHIETGTAFVIGEGGGGTSIDPALFQTGFSDYRVVGRKGVTLSEGTSLAVSMPVLRFTGTSIETATGADPTAALELWTPPTYTEDQESGILGQRGGASLTLAATLGAVKGSDRATGQIMIGRNSSIIVDPGQSITLLGSDVSVDGNLTAWGGSIVLDVPRSDIIMKAGIGSTNPGLIRIGSAATLDVAARAATAVDRLGRRYGIVADGGTIAIGGQLDWETTGFASTAADAFVVIESGALLDASGTSATLNLGNLKNPVPVASNGGSIIVKSNVGLYLDGTMIAKSGGEGAAGGTLGIALESATYRLENTPAKLLRSREFILSQEHGPSLVPAGFGTDEGASALTAGTGYLGVDRINDGGFDNLSLLVGGALSFAGDVSLSLGQSVRLYAGTYALAEGASDVSTVSIKAPYVRLAGVTGNGADGHVLPVLHWRYGPSTAETAALFKVEADHIDVRDRVGFGAHGTDLSTGAAVDRRGFSMVDVTSRGDLRLLAGTPGGGLTTNYTSELSSTGDITITAAQIYPATGAGGQIVAGYMGTGGSQPYRPGSVLTIRRYGDSLAPVPLSAFGNLGLGAETINQGGVVRAPLGLITLGSAINRTITHQINLLPGSVTSVSGNGLIMPYGGTVDGIKYLYDGVDLKIDGVGGTDEGRGIDVQTARLNVQEGAVLDLSGGGDLLGAGFVSGRGGSVDILQTGLANSRPGYAPGWNGDAVYAIVPSVTTGYAPVAPDAGHGDPAIGQQITVPEGVPGLAAGTYTLMPSTYALLPGAFRVEIGPDLPNGPLAGGANSIGNGSYLSSGILGFANTGIRNALPAQIILTSANAVRAHSSYNEMGYNAFVTADATRLGIPRGMLTSDASTLDLQFVRHPAGTTGLALTMAGEVRLDAQVKSEGYAGAVQVRGIDEVVAAGSTATLGLAGASVDAGALSALKAPRLVLNARLDSFYGKTGRYVSIRAERSLTIRSGAIISAADIIIGGAKLGQTDGGLLTVEEGAVLSTIGAGQSSYDSNDGYTFTGRGVLALSNGWFNLLLEDENPNDPNGLYVDLGACVTQACDTPTQLLSEGTIALATNRTLTIEPNVSYGTRNLVLALSTVNLGETAALAAARADGLVPAGLDLNQARLAELLAGNTATKAPALETLVLNASQSVNVYGAVDLDASSLDRLVLGTPAIYGYGAAGEVATIRADEFVWTGRSNLPGAPVAAALGSGSLEIQAESILFGYGPNSQASSTEVDERLALGFQQVSLNAAQRIAASGKSTLSVYEQRGDFVTGQGWNYSGGNLTVSSPILTGEAGSVFTVKAGGDVSITAPEDMTGNHRSDLLGAQIAISGHRITVDSAIVLPSGKLTLSAAEDITLAANARIDLSGRLVEIFDAKQYTWGGDLVLSSTGGNIAALEGSTIDLSAINNRAGSIHVTALGADAGLVDLAGAILGTATGETNIGGTTAAYDTAELTIRAQTLADFSGLNARLNDGGVFAARRFQIKQGDLVVGDGVRANEVQIVVDGGDLTVNGTIDASGYQVGTIRLAAAGDLTVNGTLDAHGTGLRVDSYGKIIDSPNRAIVELTSRDGTLSLTDSARIDLRVATDAKVSTAYDNVARGTLDLNAARRGTNDVALEVGGNVIVRGAKTIAVNAFRSYDDAPFAALPDVSGNRPQLITQAYLDTIDGHSQTYINAALGNTALGARLTGLGVYHLRPGVEIVSATPNGDLTVLGDLDLSGYRYGPQANRNDPQRRGYGEPGVLVLRAGGNLNIFGSINDGFAPPVATPDDNGWVLTETNPPAGLPGGGYTPFGGDIIVPIDGVVLDTGTSFPAGSTLNYDVPVDAASLPAGTVLPVDVILSGPFLIAAGQALAANVYNSDGSLAYAAGTVLDQTATLTAGMRLGAGTTLFARADVMAMTWPKGVPLPVKMVASAQVTLARGSLIPSMSEVQLVDDLGINLRPADQGFTNRNWAVAPMLGEGTTSWNLQLVAGADLASADRRAVDPASAGTILLADSHYSGAPTYSSKGGNEVLVWAPGNWAGMPEGEPVKEEEMTLCNTFPELCELKSVGGGVIVWAPGNWAGMPEGEPVKEEEMVLCQTYAELCVTKPAGGDVIVWAPGNWAGMPEGEPVKDDEMTLCEIYAELCVVKPGGGEQVWTGFDYKAPGFSVLRTGTGDLSLTAAGDIRMDSLFGVYTAGTSTVAGEGYDLPRGTLQNGALVGGDGDYSAALAAYRAWYPDHGGNLTISAGRDLVGDIMGYRRAGSATYASSAVAGNWLWRQGTGSALVDKATPTAWWINFGAYTSRYESGAVSHPATSGFTGFGTLGGGDLSVQVGGDAGRTGSRGGYHVSDNGDVRSRGLILAVGSTGRVGANGALTLTGGGDLELRVGGSLNPYTEANNNTAKTALGGSIINLRGATSVGAGEIGAVQSGYRAITLPNPLDPRGTDPFERTNANALSGVALVPGDSVFTVQTRGDQVIAGAGDATRSVALNSSPFAAKGTSYGGGGWSWFSLWTENTAINLFSAGGDMAPSKRGVDDSYALLNSADIADTWPSVLRIGALSGNLYFGASAGWMDKTLTSDVLAPSSSSELLILAAGSIYGGDRAVGGGLASRHVISLSPSGTRVVTIFDPAFVGRARARNSEVVTNLSLDGLSLDAQQNGRINTWNEHFSHFALGANSAALNTPGEGAHDPVRIYAGTGDIVGLSTGDKRRMGVDQGRVYGEWLVAAAPLRMMAGRDIVASGSLEQTNLMLHSSPTDISVVSAGRDIIYGNFTVAGPGTLEISAGRNLLMEDQAAVTSIGAVIPGDTRPGASIAMAAGMTDVNWQDVRLSYLDPANLADPARPLADPENAGKVAKVYTKDLADWLKSRYDFTGTDAEALTYFDALAPEHQRVFLRQVYFAETREGGREYNDPDSPRFGSYLRGREMIATLFPDKDKDGNEITRTGDILMFGGSGVRTNFGGNIEMLAPGGQIVIGVQGLVPPASAGVVTQGVGDIRLYSEKSILLGLSRIMTTFGGSIFGWSATGDINAGRGAKTTVLYTPPLRTYDAYGNVRLAPQVPSSGAGIATLNPIPEVAPGDIDLIAPLGTIDAGEAGIRVSGNINLAALQVLNAANIKVQGEASGIPVAAAVNTGALTSASSAASAVANQAANLAERSRPQVRTEVPTIVTVTFAGFGE
ncbi:filamentous haemagglutinin family protein [Sphingopyxis sp. R3-92]|uniref:filamentous haemagglutinin family protein n=1 Tax=Sphingopyxis sp. R3-92 TaxID=3158553 RepID=UPI003EE4E443